MTWAALVELVVGVLKFPDAILRMVRIFQKTPQEQHEDILKSNEEAARKFEETGRPSW